MSFSDDFPYELIAERPTLDDPGVARLAFWVGRYPSRAPATLKGFLKFRRMLEDCDAPWKDTLESFLRKMVSGKYANEFGQFANQSETGHFAPGEVSVFGIDECSQVSELFSFFSQAVYDQTLNEELGLCEVNQ